MPNEIERKFLVASDDWKKLATHSVRIRDGLIAASNGRKVRVRIASQKATNRCAAANAWAKRLRQIAAVGRCLALVKLRCFAVS